MISLTSVLLPEPDTPVTHTNTPNGISMSTFLRLLARAPMMEIEFSPISRLFFGDRDLLSTTQVVASYRVGCVDDGIYFTLRDDVPSVCRLLRGLSRRCDPQRASPLHRAQRLERCFLHRASSSASRSGGRRREDADLRKVRRRRTRRPSTRNRSAWRVGFVAPRRRTACQQNGQASDS